MVDFISFAETIEADSLQDAENLYQTLKELIEG